MFKSYYVVWKQQPDSFHVADSFCLNRTMQYGNIFIILVIATAFFLFKSYYVVWKRKKKVTKKKLKILFKSYYVVWKPVDSSFGSDHPSSLNRTMQYGN